MNPDVCIHCFAPGCVDGTAQHAKDCPRVTHVYTYTTEDAGTHGGFVCIACDDPFTVGDSYVTVGADPRHHSTPGALDALADIGVYDADIEWTLCIGCAALGREVS